MIEIIRKVLEKHKIQIDTPKYGSKQPWVPHKCTGCPWIGWDHIDHLAAMIGASIARDRYKGTAHESSDER